MSNWLSPGYVVQRFAEVWNEAIAIWASGGWAMYPIAILAIIMFGMGIHIYLSLASKGYALVREKTWRKWIDRPEKRRGPVGKLLTFVDAAQTVEQMEVVFQELRATEIAPFTRDLRVMRMCVSAAPLLGLLGTVTGMLSTFAALASGAGGDQTMELVASGISEALVTTETGLVIALPGLFLQYQLTRKLDAYKAFLAHLETVCTQKLYFALHDREAA